MSSCINFLSSAYLGLENHSPLYQKIYIYKKISTNKPVHKLILPYGEAYIVFHS